MFGLTSNNVQLTTAHEAAIQDDNDWGPDINSLHELEVDGTTENETFKIHGRRIVNIAHVMKEMMNVGKHPLKCTMGGYKLKSESRNGVACTWNYYCDNVKKIYSSEPPGSSENVNSALVWDTLAIGNGYSQTEEFLSVLDVSMMTGSKFRNQEDKVEESELLESLPLGEQCPLAEERLVRFLYQSKLKKYHTPGELLPSPQSPLALLRDNGDLAVCQAERHYYNCSYQRCMHITEEVLKKDPYHSECLPVHIGCLVELKKSIKLFYLAHKLVDHYPEVAISWFAVGCYYYVIGKSDPARRYLAKATTLDKLFGPAWLAYGHSFAAENEHDQAMAAYFKASQLMKGCHLPLLYIGLEYGLTNNVKLADKFFQQALSIAPHDPFIIHEMGVIAFQNQNYELAEKHFLTALKIVETIKEPVLTEKWEALLNNLGHTCRKLRKYSQALEYHRQALLLSPLNPSTFSAMGYVYSLCGDTSLAIDMFHKALGIRRDDTFSTTMLGYVVEQFIESTPSFPGAPEKLPVIVELDASNEQPCAVTPDIQPVPAMLPAQPADSDSSRSALMSLDMDLSDSAMS